MHMDGRFRVLCAAVFEYFVFALVIELHKNLL